MQCRSPLGYFMTEWRSGRRGAFVMGLNHGVFCIGCCWMLMALMFAAGVMNLAWAAALTMLVLLERQRLGAAQWRGLPARRWWRRGLHWSPLADLTDAAVGGPTTAHRSIGLRLRSTCARSAGDLG